MLQYIYPRTISQNLATDKIPERIQFLIFGVAIALQYFIGRHSFYDAYKSNDELIIFLIRFIGGLLTLFVAYSANGSNNGKNFIQRYMILASILYFWVNLFGYAAYIAIYYAVYYLIQPSKFYAIFSQYGIATIIYSLLFYGTYLWLVAKYMAVARSYSNPIQIIATV